MNAISAVQQASVDLVINGRIDPERLLAPAECLANHFAASPHAAEAAEFLTLVKTSPGDAGVSYDRAVALIELLGSAVQSVRGPGSSALRRAVVVDPHELRYDSSHEQDILDSFASEVTGHLESIERGLLYLENAPADAAALNAVFGALHSLKGIMGFLDVAQGRELSHLAEALIENARRRPTGLRRADVDAILHTVDLLRTMQERIAAHSHDRTQPFPALPQGVEALRAQLQALSQRRSASESGAAAAAIQFPAAGEIASLAAAAVPADRLAPAADSAPALQPPAPEHAAEHDHRGETRVIEQNRLVRVKVEKLDSLLDTVGELVVLQTQVAQDPALASVESQRFLQNLSQMGKIMRDLQGVAMSLRLFPLRDVFARMSRIARDLARDTGKQLDLFTEGDDIELDKNVIEALADPLAHIVRNAIDHGIESPAERRAAGKPERASLTLVARQKGSSVALEIRDDGRGLDLAKIEKKARERGLLTPGILPSENQLRDFIFQPGFSTAEKVTAISGRGVGMDVVRRNIENLGGRVGVTSRKGEYCEFLLSLPLTLSIIDGLVVRVGHERYIVPITNIVETVRPAREQLSTVQGRGELVQIRGEVIPLVRLASLTGVARHAVRDAWDGLVMIVECGSERCALLIDELLGQQQVVIKNLGDRLRHVKGVAGGAILGDGRVGLILDTQELLELSRTHQTAVL